jgi:acyl-CoA hydrolase
MTLQPRDVRESRVEMTQIVMPGSCNAHHTAFGGTVMSWVDICAAISAQRYARRPVVTASVDNLHFVEPIKLGMVVALHSQVNMAWRSSMEVGVRVESEDPLTGFRRHALTAYLTFVALQDDGTPAPVPPALAVDPVDQRRKNDAEERRAARLSDREKRRARHAAITP